MGRLVKFLKNTWPVFVIIIAAFLVRVWRLEELFYFTYDESIPAFVGRRLSLWQHIPLIGAATPFGAHMAPYFYWLLSVVLAIGKLNPIAWGWVGALIAIATTAMIFVIGKDIGGKKVAITAAIFWAFSYLANVFDRHFWALYWGPLLSLVAIYSLLEIKKGKQKFIILLSAALAFGIHADLSNYVLLLFAVIVWILYKLPVNRSSALALLVVIFSFLPLAVFDIRHNFANSRPLLEFWQRVGNNPSFSTEKILDSTLLFPRTASRLLYTFGDAEISKQYSYCRNYIEEKFAAIPLLVMFVVAAVILFSTIYGLKSNNRTLQLLSLLIMLYFLGIQLYGTIFKADIFEHYITGLAAAILIIFAKLLSNLPRNWWLLALAIFISLNLYKLSVTKSTQGLAAKRQAIEYTIEQVGGKPFSLDSLSTCWKLNGYRYLFAVFGREPVKSYVDPNFAYLYGTTPVAEKHPDTVVALVVHDFAPETDEYWIRYALLKSHETKSAFFGNIEVIVMDNSSGWFDQSQP